jgi:hypothetical protein
MAASGNHESCSVCLSVKQRHVYPFHSRTNLAIELHLKVK